MSVLHIKDILYIILLKCNVYTTGNIARTNKRSNELCEQIELWNLKFKNDYCDMIPKSDNLLNEYINIYEFSTIMNNYINAYTHYALTIYNCNNILSWLPKQIKCVLDNNNLNKLKHVKLEFIKVSNNSYCFYMDTFLDKIITDKYYLSKKEYIEMIVLLCYNNDVTFRDKFINKIKFGEINICDWALRIIGFPEYMKITSQTR